MTEAAPLPPDDKNLPSVPPLQLSVPADYPDQSPYWADGEQYGKDTHASIIVTMLFERLIESHDLAEFKGHFKRTLLSANLKFASCSLRANAKLTAVSSPCAGTNSFLQSVHRNMTSKLLQLPDKHSVTELLNTWAQSVRLACLSAA